MYGEKAVLLPFLPIIYVTLTLHLLLNSYIFMLDCWTLITPTMGLEFLPDTSVFDQHLKYL